MGRLMQLTAEQIAGAEFLRQRRVAMLADRVGFGKTAQLALACDLVGAERVTIICPPILRVNEVRQFEQWGLFGWQSAIIRTAKDKIPNRGLVVISYDLARVAGVARRLTKRGCDVLILDEAHRVKTPSSKTTRAIFNKAGIASTAARVWFASGEPTPNNASELYVFAKVAGAWTGTAEEFTREYCITTETDFGLKVWGTKAERRADLKALLAPYMLQRDGIETDRAPLYVDDVYVDAKLPTLTGDDLRTLQRVTAAIASGEMGALDDPFIATMRRLAGVAKASAVADLVLSLPSDEKAIVFCQHTAVIDEIAAACAERGVHVIDGRTPQRERQTILDAFQHGGACRVLVAHMKAAGEGLTLTAATRVILAEPDWSPAQNTQAIARAWRRGQSKPVHASLVYLPGTIDDAISATLTRKARDVASLRLQA